MKPTAACLAEINRDTPSMWDRLIKSGERFGIRNGSTIVPLTSYAVADLPPLPARISWPGRFMARHSPFARILARRVGKEEVTFYALIDSPEGKGFSHWLDRLFLRVGGPPLNWRRGKVVEHIREALAESLAAGCGRITFWDIGSGAGFDSLDLARQLEAWRQRGHPTPDYRLINVDLDNVWLAHNERLATVLFPPDMQRRLLRRHQSIFDYLGSPGQVEDFKETVDLIVSCNGFADFLTLPELEQLLRGIQSATRAVSGRVRMVMPMAMGNLPQQVLSRLVGFDYRARPRRVMEELLRRCLSDFACTARERHSQVVFHLSRGL